MAKYRKLPVVVEVVPYEPGMEDGHEKMCTSQYSKYGCNLVEGDDECRENNCPSYKPYIFDGYKRAILEQGDYIVIEDGRKNIVKPDIFAATYEPADTPSEVERLTALVEKMEGVLVKNGMLSCPSEIGMPDSNDHNGVCTLPAFDHCSTCWQAALEGVK